MKVVKRDGSFADFDRSKIESAIRMAFLKDADGNQRPDAGEQSSSIRLKSGAITDLVMVAIDRRGHDGTVQIEDIQDQVELALMRAGEHKVARDYVLYRERRAQQRAAEKSSEPTDESAISIRYPDGTLAPLNTALLRNTIVKACSSWNWTVDPEPVIHGTMKQLYDGATIDELLRAPILTARTMVERDPRYSYVAARLLLESIRSEVLARTNPEMDGNRFALDPVQSYAAHLQSGIRIGVDNGRLDPRMKDFDLSRLGHYIDPERDRNFQYLGLQILYDRYFLHESGTRTELPQSFWMRVAMGLALHEQAHERDAYAERFYDVLSTFRFVSSTPTLFNSGTTHPQLSSCFLSTIPDDLDGIFAGIKENAMLSKYSGGLGNDWTPVRAMGSHIKGTNGKSQGVVPFLKVVNDTAIAVNQGGRRPGAVCAYLETWHLDIEEFLELRKNTGDDRRRTHDMDTANWIPDLFMERVDQGAEWTLFSPNEVPDLHETYGAEFKALYEHYEHMAELGEIRQFKKVSALQLWRKMLTMLFETGHPWITFKDPCNLRSPQRHVGVVHSSNLCTEITLNSGPDETAVCNLGSINLVAHTIRNPVIATHGDEVEHEDWPVDVLREYTMTAGEVFQHIHGEMLQDTVRTAMRMLDNVIDLNLYPSEKARNANLRHRAVGLGIMGFADALHLLQIPMDSEAAVAFADSAQEIISYHAIEASATLAEERGSYASFPGSLWSQGILPIDSIRFLEESRRGCWLDKRTGMDDSHWDRLREMVRRGMRNSNCLAIAPTATISNIVGVSQGIDPVYQNLFVKSNLSGEFTVVDQQMYETLDKLEIWDDVMVNDLKYFDGSLQAIARVPDWVRRLYATAFEIDPVWLVRMASARQKWVDQAISLNLYMAKPSGKKIDELYRTAWYAGLKTTYYLRTLGATSAEKSTGQPGTLNAVSAAPKACLIDDPTCEACQ